MDVTRNTDDRLSWVALNLLYGTNTQLGWRIVRRTLDMEISVDEFFSMSSERRVAQFPDEVAALFSAQNVERAFDDARRLLDTLDDEGTTLLISAEQGYPWKLIDVAGDAVPPVLYVSGNTDTFNARSLGIVGARGASRAGLDYAWALARLAAERGFVVVSGGPAAWIRLHIALHIAAR